MSWWEALDPDVQKYAAGGVVTGTIALIGTIVTFVLSGIRDGRRETARRDADRDAEDARRKADREAEDRRRKAELDDRREARDHARAEEVRDLSTTALREALSISVGLLATWDAGGGRVWTREPSVSDRLQALRAAALTVNDAGVRESVRKGVRALWGTEMRYDMGYTTEDFPQAEERKLVNSITELLAAALRGDTREIEERASFIATLDRDTSKAWEDRYGEPAEAVSE